MNKQPLSNAKNRDLPSSFHALKRAANRARHIAEQTGTALVVVRNGVVTLVQPNALTENAVQEPKASYKEPR